MSDFPENGNSESPQTIIDRIISAYIGHGSHPTPVVLACPVEMRPYALPTPRDWPVQIFTENSEFSAHASLELIQRPTIVVPRWDREHESRSEIYESTLLNIDSTTANHPLIALLPAFALTSNRGRIFRKELFFKWHPSMIAFTPGALSGVHRSVVSAIIALTPKDHGGSITHMLEAPAEWRQNADEIVDDFTHLLKMHGGTRKFGYALRTLPHAGDSMGFRDHDPRLHARRHQLADFGRAVRLDELFDALPLGLSVTALNRTPADTEGATRYLTGREIQQNHSISEPDEKSLWVSSSGVELLRPGDIVLRVLYPRLQNTRFSWSRVSENDLPLTGGNSVAVLRPREALPRVIEDFVLRYLESYHAPELIEGVGVNSGPVHLTRNIITSLQVPYPDESIQSALSVVQYARDRAGEWQKEAEDLLSSIFDDETAAESRRRILRESRSVRWRVQAADIASDLSEQVRRQFPYPIAYRWRVADALLSANPSRDGFLAALDTAEQILAYIANVILALSHSAELQLKSIIGIRKKLAVGQGPTMGDWAAILDEVAGKKFSNIDLRIGTADLREFCHSEEIRAARRWLSNRRNDEAHNRRVDATQLQPLCNEAREQLMVLLQGASFLVDLPLLLIESTKWDSLTNSGTISFQRLMGDHAIVRYESMTVSAPTVESGSLYLLDINNGLHLLRPFLVGRHCPTCRNLSIFHVDTAHDGKITIKSLEHGHTVTDSALWNSLRAVSLVE